MSVPVKICGLTDPSDARLCHELGAALLGLVFAEGPRRVDAEVAQAIRAAVPQARLVGVFLDAPVDEIAATARRAGLDLIQLHGAETAATVAEVRRRTGLPVIKAARAEALDDPAAAAADHVLGDLPKGAVEPDARERLWTAAAARVAAGAPLILAGGLRPQDVAAAVARVRPLMLDVASGVERRPGRKDPELVRRFLEEARRVDA